MTKVTKIIWKNIPQFQNHLASNTGLIKNKKHNRVLKPYNRIAGNRPKASYVCIVGNNGIKTIAVHQLIMAAFNPQYDPKITIDHKNRNPFDNNLSNLRWATKKEQTDNRVITRKREIIKVSSKAIEKMYRLSKTKTLADISIIFNMPTTAIYWILTYVHPRY